MENEERFINSLRYADLARALSRDFFRVFCVNTATDYFVEFIPHEQDESLDIHMKGPDFRIIVRNLIEDTYSLDLDKVRTAFTKENILNVLEVDQSFSLNYRMVIDGTANYVRLKAARIRRDDASHVLVALSNTDAHMQRLAIYERAMQKNLTYAAVSEALASDYVCIYYVNTLSGEYIEYKSSEVYKTLGLERAGNDFFETCRTEFAGLIYEEDRDTFLNAFVKENLTRVLSVDRLFVLTFRIMLNGKPTYIRLKVTKMIGEDDHHIVVGLSNVDASMQRTAKYQQMKEIANRDSLTGVKSKHAYTVAEDRINREIEEGRDKEFAVAVFDVNGLKQINDTLGHKAGDQYIIDACMLICEVFKRSPVYRIGGDEFAVLMKGHDYENSKELIDTINHIVEENQKSGGVVISVGISSYVKGEDHTVADVFEKADALMYQRKAQLKGIQKNG